MGVVQGAVVLFPYPNEDEYQRHKFYESLASVEIGGLPFLPSHTFLVERKIRELLAKHGFLTQ